MRSAGDIVRLKAWNAIMNEEYKETDVARLLLPDVKYSANGSFGANRNEHNRFYGKDIVIIKAKETSQKHGGRPYYVAEHDLILEDWMLE